MTDEASRFDTVVRRLLSVSHDELVKREKAWKRKRASEYVDESTILLPF
jgi:hypothetical protein